MRETATHIAGLDVNVAGRVIQRCAVCGYKLCDSKGVMVEEGTGPFPVFAMGAVVQVTEGNPTEFCVVEKTDIMPDDVCLKFIED